MDDGAVYRACESRDPRFDGRIFVAVRTTGIFCRPVCPVPMPKPQNVEFFTNAAAASAAGFRPCKRCRPEAAPGSALWIGSPATVARALRLIERGYLDGASSAELAREVLVGERQLRRLFDRHVGASPAEVATARRLALARLLIDRSLLPLGRVAFEAGFSSVRQFNERVRDAFGDSPSNLRRAGASAEAGSGLTLRLAFRPPFDWEGLLAFLALRAVPGVEEVVGGAYRRTVRLGGRPGLLEVRRAEAGNQLLVSLDAADDVGDAVGRVRHLFDLDADPSHVHDALGNAEPLATVLRARPGLRVPGCWDGFELAVRAVLGQQVSVAGARSLAARLVRRLGEPLPTPVGTLTHLFPVAERLAEDGIAGLTAVRARALRRLAQEVSAGTLRLAPGADIPATVDALAELPGFGPWTAGYVGLRALADPDAFPAGDLGLRKAFGRPRAPASAAVLEAAAERWRPWRAYAAIALWRSLDEHESRATRAA